MGVPSGATAVPGVSRSTIIKQKKNMKKQQDLKTRAAYQEGTVSVVGNVVLFALKMWAGVVTGSLALMADAWHTLSDSLSSVIVILAAMLSRRKPDKAHPFGHGRWEQIAAIAIAMMLGIIAYSFLTDSVERLQQRESTTFGTLAIVVTVISIVAKEGMAQYAFWLGKKSDNLSVKADAWHHRTDALSSLVVLVGILCAKHFWWIDGALGIVIALMLFYATFEIMKETINKILGEKPPQELVDNIIRRAAELSPADLQMHHFHLHNYVTHQELTCHIRLPGDLPLSEGHAIATRIEQMVEKEFGICATIHVEPLGYEHPED